MIELARSRAYFEVSDKLLELCNKLARKTTLHQQTRQTLKDIQFQRFTILSDTFNYARQIILVIFFFNEESIIFYL